MKPAFLLLLTLFLVACSKEEEADILVSCGDLSSYEDCERAEQCVWQFSDLDPQTLQIMSPSYCREL